MSPGPDRSGWGYRDYREAAGPPPKGGCGSTALGVFIIAVTSLAMAVKMGPECICPCSPCGAARRGSIWGKHCGKRARGCPK